MIINGDCLAEMKKMADAQQKYLLAEMKYYQALHAYYAERGNK
jgi:hypothetical protein